VDFYIRFFKYSFFFYDNFVVYMRRHKPFAYRTFILLFKQCSWIKHFHLFKLNFLDRNTFIKDERTGVVRTKEWLPVMVGDRPKDDHARELSDGTSGCYYFFKSPAHVPLNRWDLGEPLAEWEAPNKWEKEQGCCPCRKSE